MQDDFAIDEQIHSLVLSLSHSLILSLSLSLSLSFFLCLTDWKRMLEREQSTDGLASQDLEEHKE